MKRSEGEKVRLRHALSRMRAHVDALMKSLEMPVPIGNETVEAMSRTVFEIAMQVAKHDAYLTKEEEATKAGEQEGTRDAHQTIVALRQIIDRHAAGGDDIVRRFMEVLDETAVGTLGTFPTCSYCSEKASHSTVEGKWLCDKTTCKNKYLEE